MNEEKQVPKPATHVIENVHLEKVEKLIYSRSHEKAGAALLEALRLLKQGAEFRGYPVDPRIKQVLYTRLAAAIVSLLADHGFKLSPDGFSAIAAEHAITDQLFRASAFGNSDHLLPQMAANPTEGDHSKLKLEDGAALLKYLLTYSLRSSFGLNFSETFKRSPQITLPLWAGMCSTLLTTSTLAFERREQILGMHGVFRDATLTDAAMPALSDSYMYSSYAVRPDKHDMKATVHHLFYQRLKQAQPSRDQMNSRRHDGLRRATEGEKPTVLVCCEWFSSLHAMYRCYAPVIRQLRQRFRLVGMCQRAVTDDVGVAEFDEFVEVPTTNVDIGKLIRTIVDDVRPDVIYYPSLGMALWWVATASLRLAPVQVMTLGHPASSRSPFMDYVIAEPESIGDPALFTEEVIPIPLGSARFLERPDLVMPGTEWEPSPGTVEVAVPSMLCKLNAPFMATLRKVQDGASRKVRFHMFVNMTGLNLYQAAQEIRDWLPSAKVYERSSYADYLRHLSGCQLHLSTFPFGGTNSVIDSMMLGIPVLAKEGPEPHERFDAMMLRRAGLDEFLVAQTADDYAAKAIALVDHDGLRNNYHGFLVNAIETGALRREFFDPHPDGEAFARAMWTAFEKGARK